MSSNDIVISAHNLSKNYRIFDSHLHRVRQAFDFVGKKYYREFTALNNVSVEIRQGETVGIVGRNGSGKSTFLQLICGVSKPTSGEIRVDGRISALLELGAGFHPEFTGRENVYMQGAIMGMSRNEMDARFPAIDEFAGIGEFIDQPVKTYSSGMFVRLAFATIAHMDANVLVIDEALSVGDALFTQKCIRYLGKFKESGTLLVVSHDINILTSLCDRVLWLDGGELKAIGPTKQVCDAYLISMFGTSRPDSIKSTDNVTPAYAFMADQRRNFINASNLRNDLEIFSTDFSSTHVFTGSAKIINVELLDEEMLPYAWVVGGEMVTLRIQAKTMAPIFAPILGFTVQDGMGRAIFGDNTYLTYIDHPFTCPPCSLLEAKFTFQMPRLPIGEFSVTAAIAEGSQSNHIMLDWQPESLIFRAHAGSSTGVLGLPMTIISLQNSIFKEIVE